MSEELINISEIEDKSRKFLTFELAGEEYAVEILKVQEIIGMMTVTFIPKMPEFVKGVINLRGKVIPVIDLRIQFFMPEKEYTEKTCIIVVQIKNAEKETVMGVIVDEVYEVLDIDRQQIEPPPSLGTNVDTQFMIGIGKVGEKVVTILDIDQVLSGNQLDLLGQAVESGRAE